MCNNTEETLKHIIKECEKTKSGREIEEILGEEGEGFEEMKRISEERRKKRKSEVQRKTEKLYRHWVI